MTNLRLGYTNPTEAFFQFRLRQDTMPQAELSLNHIFTDPRP
jgi:hypothetical protein